MKLLLSLSALATAITAQGTTTLRAPSSPFHVAPENYHHVVTQGESSSSRALAKGKDSTVTKTFKFKDDFFLRFETLATAMSPDQSEVLLNALEAYGETFRDLWLESLLEDMPSNCGVEVRSCIPFVLRLTFNALFYTQLVLFSCAHYLQTIGDVNSRILHLQLVRLCILIFQHPKDLPSHNDFQCQYSTGVTLITTMLMSYRQLDNLTLLKISM